MHLAEWHNHDDAARTGLLGPMIDGSLSPQATVRLAGPFRAHADSARLRLLSPIAAQPGGENRTRDLIVPLGLPSPTVSHHLRVLLDAGLLHRDKRGRWSYRPIAPRQLTALRGALAAPRGATV